MPVPIPAWKQKHANYGLVLMVIFILLSRVVRACLGVVSVFPWLSDTGIWYVGVWQMLVITA